MKTWRFELATLLGLIPASFLLAHFGGELSQANMGLAMNTMLLMACWSRFRWRSKSSAPKVVAKLMPRNK